MLHTVSHIISTTFDGLQHLQPAEWGGCAGQGSTGPRFNAATRSAALRRFRRSRFSSISRSSSGPFLHNSSAADFFRSARGVSQVVSLTSLTLDSPIMQLCISRQGRFVTCPPGARGMGASVLSSKRLMHQRLNRTRRVRVAWVAPLGAGLPTSPHCDHRSPALPGKPAVILRCTTNVLTSPPWRSDNTRRSLATSL